MTSIWRTLTLGVASLTLSAAALAADAIQTVYHLSDGVPQAARALRNINNHLAADPNAKIVVVAHGAGIDFLLEGAQTPDGRPFAGAVGDLANKGIEFRVCNNTLVSRKIDAAKLLPESKIVPSGVAEVAKLQAREGFVYLRP